MLTAALLLAVGGCAATSTADAQRQAWLVEALVEDNRVWLSRDPALLEHKLAKMARDPYDFMRGTAAVFMADLARAGTPRARTTFLDEPAAATVMLAGDPHPENIGLLLAEDGPGPLDAVPLLRLEVNDLDGAHFGPYLWDLRRAATGLAVALHQGGCERACREAVLSAWAGGWLDELSAHRDGAATWTAGQVPGRVDPVTQELLDDVIAAGQERVRLGEATRSLADGSRRFRLDEALDGAGSGQLRPTAEEQAQIDRLMAAYQAPEGARVLDVVRRFGQGVASMPAVRFGVVWDLGDPAPDDDRMLTVREVVDPPSIPGLAVSPGLFDSHLERVDATHRTLWSHPEADPRMQALADGAMTFKVLTWSSWNTGYDHGTVAANARSGAWSADDLAAWAGHLGHQLGAVHARASTSAGEPAVTVLLADIRGRDAVFVAEQVAHAEGDLDQLLLDHSLFVEALDIWGPSLAADGLD